MKITYILIAISIETMACRDVWKLYNNIYHYDTSSLVYNYLERCGIYSNELGGGGGGGDQTKQHSTSALPCRYHILTCYYIYYGINGIEYMIKTVISWS